MPSPRDDRPSTGWLEPPRSTGREILEVYLQAMRGGDWRAAEALMSLIYGKSTETVVTHTPVSPERAVVASMTLEEKLGLLHRLRAGEPVGPKYSLVGGEGDWVGPDRHGSSPGRIPASRSRADRRHVAAEAEPVTVVGDRSARDRRQAARAGSGQRRQARMLRHSRAGLGRCGGVRFLWCPADGREPLVDRGPPPGRSSSLGAKPVPVPKRRSPPELRSLRTAPDDRLGLGGEDRREKRLAIQRKASCRPPAIVIGAPPTP
jgi:hypothetical protein